VAGLLRDDAGGVEPVGGRALVAVGWATVDLERTVSEVPGVTFDDAGEERALGARALRARFGSVDLIVLEPSTEGRLAGWLALNGEGVAVLYVEVFAGAARPRRATALGRDGELQPQPADDRSRPFVMVLDARDGPTSAPSGRSGLP
jgi:hypothetical protein